MYHPLFPTNCFTFDMCGDDPETQINEDGFANLSKEIYRMRKKDPIGRARSNADSGWQSNDGIKENPLFQGMVNRIGRFFEREIFPFHGDVDHHLKVLHGNYWANINNIGGYNNTHTHPGCWYSGVIYIDLPSNMKGGNLQLIDGVAKHYSMFPTMSNRSMAWQNFEPKVGKLILFPSTTLHFVEPNQTDGDRISIAFNNSFTERRINMENQDDMPFGIVNSHNEDLGFYDHGTPSYEVDSDGNLHFPK